jgi:hypothetical protein
MTGRREFIMLHHSLTEDGETVSWAAIEKYHREHEGWRDIGYHAGVEVVTGNPALSDYRVQALYGRSPFEQASACPQGNMNVRALHACVVGNYDEHPPSLATLKILVKRIVLPWMREYGIPPEQIVGHRDFNPAKSCPGKAFDLDLVRRLVR